MTMREWSRSPGMRIALGVLAAAAVVTLWTLVQAFRAQPLPDTLPTTIASLQTIRRGVAHPPADIQAAVENDLFSSDRTAPSSPYRMPGESGPDDKPAAAQPDKPIVLGTAVATDGRHFATVQLGDARPTLVHVGDRIGEWVVRSIERGKIVLVTAGGTRVDITVPKPGI
ncbi:MAG: hypothetical protein JWM41_3112 [Gemmatimonadetes bacterium]|nr:hypothetical protein [Gemmatimonadota bacterium]